MKRMLGQGCLHQHPGVPGQTSLLLWSPIADLAAMDRVSKSCDLRMRWESPGLQFCSCVPGENTMLVVVSGVMLLCNSVDPALFLSLVLTIIGGAENLLMALCSWAWITVDGAWRSIWDTGESNPYPDRRVQDKHAPRCTPIAQGPVLPILRALDIDPSSLMFPTETCLGRHPRKQRHLLSKKEKKKSKNHADTK